MRNILYLHGFASSPNSRKVKGISALLEPQGIEVNAPDLNVPSFEKLDFEAIVRHVLAEAQRKPPDAVVGSSLGSLIALEVVRRGVLKPLVLIAPALGVAAEWIHHIPEGDPVIVYNHAREQDARIHRVFFEKMALVDSDRNTPAVPVTLIVGRNDESVPFERVSAVWQSWKSSGRLRPGSKFLTIPEGDHGLTAFADVLAGEIREAVERPSAILTEPLDT